MNPFGLSGIIIAITNFSIGYLIYLHDRKNPINQLWFIFALSVTGWGLGSYFISITQNKEIAILVWRATLMAVIVIPFSFLAFTHHFLEINTRRLKYFTLFPCLFFIALNCSPYFTSTVKWVFNSFHFNGPTLLHSLFVISFLLAIFYAIFLLVRSYRNSTDPNRKKQLLFFTLASIIGTLGGSTSFLPTYGIEIYPYLNSTIILFPFIIGYTIAKHQLFNVRIIIVEVVVFALWIIITVRLLIAKSATQFISEAVLLFVAVLFGVLLIQGVLREIRQREHIESLTTELKTLYGYLSQIPDIGKDIDTKR